MRVDLWSTEEFAVSAKGKVLYWVDVAILLAFLLSGISGLVLWLEEPGGFQGGRLADRQGSVAEGRGFRGGRYVASQAVAEEGNLLPAGSGGVQVGEHRSDAVLGLSRGTWNDLHLWASLAMGAGVLVHLALHWSWIVCVTRRMLGNQASRPAPKPREPEVCEV